jgi:hypothetical protein
MKLLSTPSTIVIEVPGRRGMSSLLESPGKDLHVSAGSAREFGINPSGPAKAPWA